MRLIKGAKVEVLTRKEVPSGSWHCAEIIGGNGHSYTVRYDGDIGSFGVVEKVSLKWIRPCPPSVDVLEDWMPGDVVEFFHNFSWKMATVLKVTRRDHLLVRLLGSSIEFKVNKVDVRARLCWQDGEWVVIGKAFGTREDTKFRFPSSRKCNNDQALKTGSTMRRRIKVDHVSSRNVNKAIDTQFIPAIIIKRKPSHLPVFEPYPEHKQKNRPAETHNSWYQFDVKHISLRESNDDNNISSSVGSCSLYGNLSQKLHHGLKAGPCEDNDGQCSDAESSFQLRSEAKEELTEEVHKLELHAYRCIIGVLYASGPLNWEQELLLTNLRESLHISNDEHLMEIRNLVPSTACILSC